MCAGQYVERSASESSRVTKREYNNNSERISVKSFSSDFPILLLRE